MRMALVLKSDQHQRKQYNVHIWYIQYEHKSIPPSLEVWISAAILRGYFIAVHWRILR